MINYDEIINKIKLYCDGINNDTSNLSNISSILYEYINDINWIGFYLVNGDDLELGPFQGKAAHPLIHIGNGVCGTAFYEEKTILVNNVHTFCGHICCDEVSNSEIVIPIFKDKKVYGVLDIDSPVLSRFNEEDKNILEKIVKYIEGLL